MLSRYEELWRRTDDQPVTRPGCGVAGRRDKGRVEEEMPGYQLPSQLIFISLDEPLGRWLWSQQDIYIPKL